ncbi:uncharacterized protein LOC136085439 [Hydra vulgaris]|uniref:Uncharacterized protein LOC136085439 n=1 Tax=Hydra vulgaris TaxID=6087 RepID=A0ABM4CLY7_HYDVU
MSRKYSGVQAQITTKNDLARSTTRWYKLMKTLEVTLKSQSETRWSAKKEAIHSLNKQTTNVCNVLQEISNDSLLNAETRSGAREILIQVDFEFLCWLDLWNIILTLIDRGNRSLQSKNMTIDIASKKIAGLFACIQNLRDRGIRRFETMAEISSDYEFLNGNSLASMSVEDLKKCGDKLCQKYVCDLNANEFLSEIESFKFQTSVLIPDLKNANPLKVLEFMHTFSLTEAYPFIEIALRIFLTLPVTVASCERSFSKLKLLKNYLRSSMGQERLTNLAILSIENPLAKSLCYNEIVDNFASLKA